MLIAGSRLVGTPIMSLQTGTRLAVAGQPVIDPSNLKIVAYETEGPLLSEKPSFIRIADVRELSEAGMIIDSNDEFVVKGDVIIVDRLYKLGFKLIGLNVMDEMKKTLGKVSGYSIETNNFIIQQINVNRGIIKSLSDTELLIHRSQIVEINDHSIIVKAAAKKLQPVVKSEKLNYVNPFRSSSPQVESVVKY